MAPHEQASAAPDISFIIPAHNEQSHIADTLRSITHAMATLDRSHELIVADDQSTDATADIARGLGAAVVPVSLRHIAAVRNAGARHARAELLVFVDADTTISAALLAELCDARRRGFIAGGAKVRFDGPVPWNVRLGMGCWNLTSRIFRWAAGCFIFTTRQAFDAAGGFDERYFASEEIHLSAALKRLGRFRILREPVTTSARKFHAWSMWSYLKVALLSAVTFGRVLQRRDRLPQWYGNQRTDA